MKVMPLLQLITFTLLLTASPSWAALILQLSPDNQSVAPGGTVTFSGSLQNTSAATISLDGLMVTTPGGLLDSDGSAFFSASAPRTVAAGATTSVYEWFRITVPSSLAGPQVVTGTVSVLTMVAMPFAPSLSEEVGRQTFTVNVLDPTAVPEPGTWALLGAGAAVLMMLRRR